jgi:hypothetical protein
VVVGGVWFWFWLGGLVRLLVHRNLPPDTWPGRACGGSAEPTRRRRKTRHKTQKRTARRVLASPSATPAPRHLHRHHHLHFGLNAPTGRPRPMLEFQTRLQEAGAAHGQRQRQAGQAGRSSAPSSSARSSSGCGAPSLSLQTGTTRAASSTPSSAGRLNSVGQGRPTTVKRPINALNARN